MDESEGFGEYRNEAYRPLAGLYLAFTAIWFVSTCSWTLNTYKSRHFQTNKLQWTLASVPLIKALQLTLSFLFWYSCFNLHTCSLWMSFGAYVTGVLFQTASFVSFLLISLGYCIVCERLSVSERRTIAALGCAFYLTLVGYRASVPYFSVFLLLNYLVSFYMIFHHTYRNLLALREQLAFIEDEDVHLMHNAVHAKYVMFKKFQVAMQIIAVAETAIYINIDGALENYWLRLLVREWAQFCIFLYLGWTFRSQDLAPRFSVMPTLKSEGLAKVPPIYSVEMDAATFKDFSSHEWHIGVPTTPSHGGNLKDSILVIVQHPHASRITSVNATLPSVAGAGSAKEQRLTASPRSTQGMN
ncbi:uncharacterized protein LOC130761833 isoform X1 [Actinidia eriantha]|uniref:uncharacterized protein LOC130761833 isoform X1 n=1 Tax=Actinidia eriantha TaxID=165200 RepID=UPI00258C4796|nr:uncharacterized protein LOC130761833 isoform X1 [Actinidia eriantha]